MIELVFEPYPRRRRIPLLLARRLRYVLGLAALGGILGLVPSSAELKPLAVSAIGLGVLAWALGLARALWLSSKLQEASTIDDGSDHN